MLAFVAMAAAIAAALPAKAEPRGNPTKWVRAADLPEIGAGAAVTTFDLALDDAGRAAGCAVVVPSGSDEVDAAVCTALVRRARFKPAKDRSGSPLPSVFRGRVAWQPNAGGPNRWLEDADLVVSTPIISKEIKKLAEVVLVTDPSGGVEDCVVAQSVGNEALERLACSAAKKPAVSPAVSDAQGRPVRGIRAFYVGFRPGPTTTVRVR